MLVMAVLYLPLETKKINFFTEMFKIQGGLGPPCPPSDARGLGFMFGLDSIYKNHHCNTLSHICLNCWLNYCCTSVSVIVFVGTFRAELWQRSVVSLTFLTPAQTSFSLNPRASRNRTVLFQDASSSLNARYPPRLRQNASASANSSWKRTRR